MSVNYVLIFAIILIVAAMVAGHYLGTARMIYIGIVLSVSVFLAIIIDSGVYKGLDVIGVDKVIYNNKDNNVFFVLSGDEEYALDELNSSIITQTEYIENLSVPHHIRMALLENNNSKIYEYFEVQSFEQYIDRFSSYTVLCMVSFLLSLLITLGAVGLVCRITGINEYIATEKSSGKTGGVLLGFVFGIVIVYTILAITLLFLDTEFGTILYSQIKASRILNYMYENNIIVSVFMNIKIPIWIAGKQ